MARCPQLEDVVVDVGVDSRSSEDETYEAFCKTVYDGHVCLESEVGGGGIEYCHGLDAGSSCALELLVFDDPDAAIAGRRLTIQRTVVKGIFGRYLDGLYESDRGALRMQ